VDEEIDLRQYVDVIRRWSSLIILGTFLAAVTAFAVSSIMQRTYEAEAGVVVSRAKTEVSFNPNIKTVSEEELARQLDRQTIRETLANLASSSEIATKVIAQLGDTLTEEEHDPRVLMGEVEAKTDRNSDFIRITVRSTDPEKAAKIANAWARAYVNYVNNEVYSGTPQTPEEIAAQAADAKRTYDKAEANLVAFLRDNQIADLQRQIAEKQDIIASLQSGKKTAVTTVIDKELQARTQIISAYIDAQAANRLVAFRKEQEGKRKLIEAYMGAEIKNRLTAIEKDRAAREKLFSQYVDQEIQNRLLAYQKDQEARSKLFAQYVNAEIENRLLAFQKEQAAKKALFDAYTKADSTADTAVFEKQLNAKLQTLGYYYASMNKLEQILADARALRERISAGTQSQSTQTGNSLAIVLLQASAFASSAKLPVSLQIPMNQFTDLAATPSQQLHDLDALITTIEARRKSLQAAIDVQSKALLDNTGYKYLSSATPQENPLADAIKRHYREMFQVGDIASQADTAPAEGDLTKAITERYNELFSVGRLARQADQAPLGSDLSKAIMARYNELFGVGSLAKAAEAITNTTPLFASIHKQYPELFETGDLSALTESVSTDNPLAATAKEKSRALLQMEGLEQVVTYSTTDAPMTKAIDQLQKEVNQLKAKLETISAQKQELTRARDLARQTYKSLASKVAEVNVATESKSTEVKFAVPAVVPRSPVAPRRMMNTMLAAVVGFMLMLGLAFVAEYLDTTLRPDEVERTLGLPVLGNLPRLDDGLPEGQALAAAEPQSALAEALRSLRTNLQVFSPEPLRALLITSPDPAEGKSTIAANLGVVMAQSGRTVTLVDGDLRRPTLHTFFGLSAERGLSNALVEGETDPRELLLDTGVERLRLLAGGPIPPNPADLLGTDRLRQVLELLAEQADLVLLDSPATLAVSDTLLLCKHVPDVLLIAEAGVTKAEGARQAAETLTRAGARILGVVFSKVDPATLAGYYYYAGDEHRGRRRGDWWSALRRRATTWRLFP